MKMRIYKGLVCLLAATLLAGFVVPPVQAGSGWDADASLTVLTGETDLVTAAEAVPQDEGRTARSETEVEIGAGTRSETEVESGPGTRTEPVSGTSIEANAGPGTETEAEAGTGTNAEAGTADGIEGAAESDDETAAAVPAQPSPRAAQPRAAAGQMTVEVTLYVYGRTAPEKVTRVGSGFWDNDETIRISAPEVTELTDGNTRVRFRYETPAWAVGMAYTPEFYEYETVGGTVTAGADGSPSVSLLLKQLGTLDLSFADAAGAAVAAVQDPLTVPVRLNGESQMLKFERYDGASEYYHEFSQFTDDGAMKPSDFDFSASVGTALQLTGSQLYQVTAAGPGVGARAHVLTVAPAVTETLDLTVAFETPMPMLIPDSRLMLKVNGASRPVSLSTKSGRDRITYAVQVAAPVFGGAAPDVSAVRLPDAMSAYGIVRQQYDPAAKTLTIVLGRNLAVNVHAIQNGVNYGNIATATLISGIKLGLFRPGSDEPAAESRPSADLLYGQPINLFAALTPGTYTLRILDAPAAVRRDYVLSQPHELVIQDDGTPLLDPVYDGQGNLIQGGPNGPKMAYNPAVNAVLIGGWKTPMKFFIPRKPKLDKRIAGGHVVQGGQTLDRVTTVNPNDEIEFEIHRTVFPDQNAVYDYTSASGTTYFRMSSRVVLDFSDALGDRMDYIEGSLSVTENGAPVEGLEGTYDAAARRIVVTDTGAPVVYKFDFNQSIQLRPPRKIVIRFKARAVEGISNWAEDFQNTAYGNGEESSVDIIPNVSLNIRKVWQGGAAARGNFDLEQLADALTVEAYSGQTRVATYAARDYLADEERWQTDSLWSFKLKGLPKYDPATLSRPRAEWVRLRYEVREQLPEQLSSQFVTAVSSDDSGLLLTNAYVRPTASFWLTKIWGDGDGQFSSAAGSAAPARAAAVGGAGYRPVFRLIQSDASGRQIAAYPFDVDTVRLADENGRELTYSVHRLVDGRIETVEMRPVLTASGDVYRISDLPAAAEDGSPYRYNVVEAGVFQNGRDVTEQFERIVGALLVDEDAGRYILTINNRRLPQPTATPTTTPTTQSTTTPPTTSATKPGTVPTTGPTTRPGTTPTTSATKPTTASITTSATTPTTASITTSTTVTPVPTPPDKPTKPSQPDKPVHPTAPSKPSVPPARLPHTGEQPSVPVVWLLAAGALTLMLHFRRHRRLLFRYMHRRKY